MVSAAARSSVFAVTGGVDGGEPAPLLLFDCLAPFFADHLNGIDAGTTINWSKIPFTRLERDGGLDGPALDALLQGCDRYLATMAGLGYTAVAVDDLAHLVAHDFYPAPLVAKLGRYRRLYEGLFAAAKAHGLGVFVTTDYLFFNPAIEAHLRSGAVTAADLFDGTVRAAFAAHPAIDGVILRIGESDGVDVVGDFKSRLAIRRPGEARALLRQVLPTFGEHAKTLIFRTWTLGAYPIGDLIWNRRTYNAVFGRVAHPRLIVSMKYGDADFFRYLETNPLLFHGPHRKLVELQCRREYEGMGEYPSFVGWLHAAHLATLRDGGSKVAGMFALQGGGWAPFARLAFAGDGSLWNELNTVVTVKLFRGAGTVDEIVTRFCADRGIGDPPTLLRLLALSDEAIEQGLYIREFAACPAYFRRIRVPPLIWVFWHNVTTDGLVAELHRVQVRDKVGAVGEGHRAVETVREMLELARCLGVAEADLRFQLETWTIFAHLREVLLGVATPETHRRLAALRAGYRERYPAAYRVDDAPSPAGTARATAFAIGQLLRGRREYRPRDRLLLNGRAGVLKPLVAGRGADGLPRFVDTQGMSTDVLLR